MIDGYAAPILGGANRRPQSPHLYGTVSVTGEGGHMAESEIPDGGLGKTTEVTILEPAAGSMLVPAMVAAAGERAALRFIDFFTANIRNPNTRAAYGVAVRGFLPGSTSTMSASWARSARITFRRISRP